MQVNYNEVVNLVLINEDYNKVVAIIKCKDEDISDNVKLAIREDENVTDVKLSNIINDIYVIKFNVSYIDELGEITDGINYSLTLTASYEL
jgi:hypothetical protein